MVHIKTKIKSLRINYIKKGKGKNVLILPGWGTTIDIYMTLINSISNYACVYCLDMPGFGDSQEMNKPWGVNEYVDFIKEFIEKNDIEELDLIGHSNGGRIIIKLMSEKLKFKVNRIILIGSAGIVHKKTLKVKLKIYTFKILKHIVKLNIVKNIFPNLLNKLKNKFGSEDYKNASPVLKQSLIKLVNEDLKECIPNIKVPTLLIWGEKDTATPVSDAKVMEKLIPDAGLVTIKNCTHYVFLENSYYVNIIIGNFLNGGN